MGNTKFYFHTIRLGERVYIVGTQKYTIMENGEKYYLASFNYAVFDHQHLISNGSIQGSSMGKLTKEKLQETFDGVLRHRSKFGD